MQRHLSSTTLTGRTRASGATAVLVALFLLATGCGSSSSVPAVASATSSSAAATTTAAITSAPVTTAAPTCAQLRTTLTALVATMTSNKTNAEKAQDALAAASQAIALARNGDGALKTALDKLNTDLRSLSTSLSNGEKITTAGGNWVVKITGDVLSITALCTT